VAKGFSVFVDIGGRINSSLTASVRQAEGLVRGLSTRMAAINTATQGVFAGASRSIADAGKGLQAAGARSTATVTAPLTLLGMGAAKMAFEFEKAGNMLEALGDATAQQRKEFEAYANDLNKKYPQTLTEIIKTGNEMLKGGFEFDQMKGALDQTIATAVLGEMTPSEVGNMMARTINSFQLPMKTYQEAMRSSQRVSDQMTYAAVKTTASLKDMGEMYRYVGGASSAAGIPLEQATAFAMAFAKNGSVGSDAGVAMRSAIVRMIKPVKPQIATMARIGMKLSDYVGSRALSADGIVAGLQADGIDASSAKKQIGKLIKNPELAKNTPKLTAEITKIVQSALKKSGSAMDASVISSSVMDAVTMAGSKVDLFKFFTDLKAKIDKGEATSGDLASLLEGRHFSRYIALLQSDLPALLKGVQTESDGYTQSRYGIVLKGIVGPVYELDAAMEKLSVTLGRIAFPDLAKGLTALSDGLTKMSEANPELLKLGLYATAAAVAFGPLAMAAGASLRVLGGLVGILGAIGTAATVGLAARLTAIASGVTAITVATSVAAIARLRLFAAGLIALSAVGGVSGVMAAVGGSLLALGRVILALPLTLLKVGFGALAAVISPVGIAVGVVLASLTALGVWVYNNLSGIGTFFSSFGESFMKALGPEAASGVSTVVGWLKQAWEWASKLLGPIDETGQKWASWGEMAGRGAAAVVNALGTLPAKIGELARQGYDALVNFQWSTAGKAIVDAIVSGITGAAGALADAVRSAARNAVSGIAGYLGLGGGSAPAGGAPAATGGATPAPSAPGTPAIAGARALGGPVQSGLPYLVGERGPEIFVPQQSGRIETNGVLNSISKAGGAAPGGLRVPVDASAIEQAGETAQKAGRTIHASLDTTTKPIVDTASIDAALAKVGALKGALGGLGGEGGAAAAGGTGGGGSSGGAAVGGSLGGASRAPAAGGSGGRPALGGVNGAPAVSRAGGAVIGSVPGAGSIYQALRTEGGFSHVQAAAILGHMMEESTLNTGAWNSKEGAGGLIQWRKDRLANLKAYAASKGLAVGDPRAQAGFIRHEMLGAEKRPGSRFLATTTLEEASAALKGYIRYGSKTAADRLGHGRNFERQFRNGVPAATPPAVAGRMPGAEKVNPGYGKPLHQGGTGLSRYSDEDLRKMTEAAKAAEAAKVAATPAIAGARALGGPVTGGKSYLVGEYGPEIFTAGTSGTVSTNDTLNGLTAAGKSLAAMERIGRVPEGGQGGRSIAPTPEAMAEASPRKSITISHGGNSVSLQVHAGGNDGASIGRAAEDAVWRVLRRLESEQRGNLSD
jgi:TP901 family phage tail tape measure protein